MNVREGEGTYARVLWKEGTRWPSIHIPHANPEKVEGNGGWNFYWKRAQEYETDGEEAEMDTEMDGQQLTIARLRRELADKDREIKSMKAILKKIGVIANNMSEDSTQEGEEDPSSTPCRADMAEN